MAMRSTLPQRFEVTIDINGQAYSGYYTLTGGKVPMITVDSEYGSKSTQLGGMPPERLAKTLLRELVSEQGPS